MKLQQAKKDFSKILNDLDRSKSLDQHFRNFCEMSYCALAKSTALSDERADQLEEQYMSIVHSYSDKDDVRRMPELLAITLQALNINSCDFLGELAGEMSLLDARSGQFFTPFSVSKMLALISMNDCDSLIERDGFFTISDPAAGAGCTILAAATILEEKGHDPSDVMSAHVIELNRFTYHMLYVQLSLRGIPAAVFHGNSLSLEMFESAYTPASKHFHNKHGTMFKESHNPITTPLPAQGEQLSLF